MAFLNRLAGGFGALLWKKRSEGDLDDELRAYLNSAIDQKMSSGMTRDDATRAARAEMGSMEATKDDVRDVAWETRVDTFLQDVRFAARSFLTGPRFTIPALLALALSIGATSAIFSVVRGVILQPLPYHEPDRIVGVWETTRGGASRNVIAPANFVAWRERNRSFEHLGMVGPSSVAMVVNSQPDLIQGLLCSSGVFDALGVQPALGRAYTPDEDADAGNAVIVLSHEFWQRRLGGRRDVLGLALTTDGRPRSVIGVMPPGFTVVGRKADYLIPYGQTTEQLRAVRGRGSSFAIARLREGVSFEQAFREMKTLAAQLAREEPQRNALRSVMLFSLQDQMVGELRPALFALVGGVLLVLLVGCINVANLLLARSAARERELGMRTALGARRGRLVRQMITESFVLAAAGGVAGLAVSALFHRGLLALLAGERTPIPRLEQVALDLPVVAFTMVVALATGVLFGLAPAFVSTSNAGDALREGGRHGGGRRLRRVLNTLVVAEVALSLALLAGAGLLMRSFIKLQSVDPGFRAEGVLIAQVVPPAAKYDLVQAGLFLRESLSRVSALPGVERAAGLTCLPLAGPCIGTSFWRADRPPPAAGEAPSSHVRPVTPASFRTLEIPQIGGRDFSAADTADSPPVAVVSESLVKQEFAGEDPLGRRLRINANHANGKIDMEWTIVGVVRDIKGSSLEGEVRPTIYVPEIQIPSGSMAFVVRTRQDPMLLANSVRRIVRSMDAEAPVTGVRTLEDFVGSTIARPRAITALLGVFAFVALVLAAVGVYGVMAYSVSQRTQEIGVRMALGASTQSVFRLVLGQALRLVAMGVAAGLIAAGAFTRVLGTLLYKVEPLDPWTFGVTALVLLLVATIATYLPARRGMRVAPVDALRTK